MIRVAIAKASILATVLAVATIALSTNSASAHLIGYEPVANFGSPGAGAGQFNTPVGVGIDESNGDVYVVDQGNKRVERFSPAGAYLSQFDGSETPEKSFTTPTYVAVDNSGDAAKGHVYVADRGEGVVDTFDSTGKYLFQIKVPGLEALTTDTAGHLWVWTSQASFEEYGEAGEPMLRHAVGRSTAPGIAVDSRGDVYGVYGNGCMGRYSPPSFEDNNFAQICGNALAINPTSDNIFQDDGSNIVEWPPFGEGPGLWERTEEVISGGFANSHGLAINGRTEVLYVSDEAANDVEVLDGIVPVPPVIEGPPAAADATRASAVIHATINAKHSSTTYHVLYVEAADYQPAANDPYEAGGVTSPSIVPTGPSGEDVDQLLSGLKPATTYHYEIVATNPLGTVTSPDSTFTTGAATPPRASTGGASGVGQNVATVAGVLSTNGLPSTYGFEIGTTTNYGPPTGLGAVGAGASETSVTLALTGLRPGTVYHYRLTATNVDGTSYGADETFTTTTYASAFASPPAPLPFVEVPALAFPSAANTVTVQKHAPHKARHRARKHRKVKHKGKKK